MAKILGLDIGDLRIGTALADSTTKIALPHESFLTTKGEAERRIIELIQSENIKLVIVGIPLSDSNAENAQSEKVRNFCRRLQKRVQVELKYVDEYGSSVEAEERLSASGRKKARADKGVIDALSAAIILERYFAQLVR